MTDSETIEALRILYSIPADQDLVTGLRVRFKSYIEEKYVPTWQAAWTAVYDALNTKDPLLSFASWYSTWLNGNMSFAQHYGVTSTKLGTGLILFRLPPFQVQLFCFTAGSVIVPHSHPDVESFEVYVGGDMQLTCDYGAGPVDCVIPELACPDETGRSLSNGGMVRIPAGATHGGLIKAGPQNEGGAFMSIQYWLNGVEPKSIQYNWDGKDGSQEG